MIAVSHRISSAQPNAICRCFLHQRPWSLIVQPAKKQWQQTPISSAKIGLMRCLGTFGEFESWSMPSLDIGVPNIYLELSGHSREFRPQTRQIDAEDNLGFLAELQTTCTWRFQGRKHVTLQLEFALRFCRDQPTAMTKSRSDLPQLCSMAVDIE